MQMRKRDSVGLDAAVPVQQVRGMRERLGGSPSVALRTSPARHAAYYSSDRRRAEYLAPLSMVWRHTGGT